MLGRRRQTMTTQPSSLPGGRSLFRVVAVLLALGVLGYLMWRSQANAEVPSSPAVGDPQDFGPGPGLSSSKSLVIDPAPVAPLPADSGQTPTTQPPQTTPR